MEELYVVAHQLTQRCSSLWAVSALRELVVREAGPIATAFAEAGYSLFLVGGIVRDLHLDSPLDALDFDLTTDALPVEVKRLVDPLATAVWTQGEKFGTIGCQINGRPYEITTHRAESYTDEARKPEVQFGDDIMIDLSRRDFTVNAMAIDLMSSELIDPFNGRQDLEDRVLRTPIEPSVSFADDPLRILRAARFIARYDLAIAPDVTNAATSLIDRMSIVSTERIRDELDKLLAAPAPSRGLAFFAEVGAWPYVSTAIDVDLLPEISEELDRSSIELVLRRAIIFSRVPADERRDQLEHLRYSNAESRQLRQIPDRKLAEVFGELDASEDLSDVSPSLAGEDVMELLSIEPGPEVGAALSVLQERRYEHGPIDREAEVAFLVETYRR